MAKGLQRGSKGSGKTKKNARQRFRATLTCVYGKSAMDTLVHRFTLIFTSCAHFMRAETAALIHVVRLLRSKVTNALSELKIFANNFETSLALSCFLLVLLPWEWL